MPEVFFACLLIKSRPTELLLPMKISFCSLALLSSLLLSSCETTGDPTQGGLFGWSENKAQGRIYDKRYQLNQIQADTDAQVRRSSSLEAERSRLQQQAR